MSHDQPAESDGPARPSDHGDNAAADGDSGNFTRCAACAHAKDVDGAAGALFCAKHDMRIDAEADEIPDDCPSYTPAADVKADPHGD